MRPPGPVQACPDLRNCLRHRYAWPQKPVWAWVALVVLSKGGQDWTGYPPTPLRLTPTAPGPRGVKAAEPLRISPRDLGNKKQAVPWVSRSCLGCLGVLVRLFLRFKGAIVKKNYQGEGSGGVFRLVPDSAGR